MNTNFLLLLHWNLAESLRKSISFHKKEIKFGLDFFHYPSSLLFHRKSRAKGSIYDQSWMNVNNHKSSIHATTKSSHSWERSKKNLTEYHDCAEISKKCKSLVRNWLFCFHSSILRYLIIVWARLLIFVNFSSNNKIYSLWIVCFKWKISLRKNCFFAL